jgi:SanA protein
MKNSKKPRSIFAKLSTVALLLLTAGFLCYGALVAFVYYQEVHVPVPTEKADAIIVLGAQVQPSGEPSVQLAWRLEAALEVFNQNPVPIVVSGGQGGNEPRPEGDVMRDWLIEKGVPKDKILVDSVSANTRQNILHAISLLSGLSIKNIRIVTSDYHLPRALAIARDEGLSASGTGSPCKKEYWVQNHFREALAWVKYWGQKYLHLPLE